MKYLILSLFLFGCGAQYDRHSHAETNKQGRKCYYSSYLGCYACEYNYNNAVLLNCQED